MTKSKRISAAAPVLAAAVLIAGCASANKTASTPAKTAGTGMAGMKMKPGQSMAGMNMGTSASSASSTASSAAAAAAAAAAKETKAVSVDGITAIPSQSLGTTDWQGMKISAMAMTAVPFIVYDGTSEREIKPSRKTSFHLMVMLNDSTTNEPIPYATVWATISQHGKVLYDERTWPMISRYMGPHYGNDVTVPGAGTYQLSLLVAPPVSARHMEYANVWTQPHRVSFTFHWNPPTT